MRVLHVITRFTRGGAERNLAYTIGWELGQGFDVHLAVGRDHVPTELPSGATVHVIENLVRSIDPMRDIRALWTLRGLARSMRFDVVHTHESKAGIIGRLAARGGAPVVLHTIHMASFGPAYNRVASRVFQLAERLCARWTTRIISVGRELAEMYLAAGIGHAAKYVVIRSPIHLAGLIALRGTSPADRNAARSELGLRPDVPVALVLSALEPRKRVDLILTALQKRLAAGSCQLMVGGEGTERTELERRAQMLGIRESVVFAGHLDDVVPAFRAADVLVHAATVEGVPQVVIQALAVGIPVAATDMMGLREVDGASIQIASPTGNDLGPAVERSLTSPGTEVSVEALDQWAPSYVSESLSRLYSTLPTRSK